jgi:hypothetical protein
MKSIRLVPISFLKLVLPASFLMCLPGVGRAQLVTTATYTANNGGTVNVNQKVIAVGADGYTRFVIKEDTGAPDHKPELTYVRCLDQGCQTYNTQHWEMDRLSPYAFSLAIGPDGYARIAYQLFELVYSPDGEYHNGILGFIQCLDIDCGSSTNNSFVDYTADDGIASVAVGNDGTAYIVYDNGNADDGPQGIGLATCSGGGCSTSSLVTGISVFDLTAATIAVGSDGNPVVAYADDHFSSDGYLTYISSTGHYYENGTDTVASSDASLTDLSIGPDGFARIYFQNHAFWDADATPGATFVKCNNVSCSSAEVNPITLSGVTFASYGSLAVTADGTPRAEVDLGGYPDSSYYVECSAADCSTYDSSLISVDSGDSAELASLSADQNDIPIMIVEGLSNGVVFQVKGQVPTSLQVLSADIISPTYFRGGCNPATMYYIALAIKYQVLDQDNPPKPIKSTKMRPQEKILNFVINDEYHGDPEPDWGDIGTGSSYPGTSTFTDSNGQFIDAPIGQCASEPFINTYTQPISMLLNSINYTVRINNWTETGGFASGSMTNGTDVNKSYP